MNHTCTKSNNSWESNGRRLLLVAVTLALALLEPNAIKAQASVFGLQVS